MKSPMLIRIEKEERDSEILHFAFDTGAFIVLVIAAITLLTGCGSARPIEESPNCPRLYCATTGEMFVWDSCQPHPHFDGCAQCHQPHTPGGMIPIPCSEVVP